ncbi:hypothetical protein L1987_55706 [Smallanthus sonchifolius]|uniref:Uncharacterized protein n=1 Tax=Smallanthus sonchifolius TaxID=185202 RepID=A0ACB9EAP6_9ASTR|nr:hypothetical protein L1987_55706 [Smallanthus sonchifolius]
MLQIPSTRPHLYSVSMEGIGSRTGRPSSRYGSAAVFTGPVRRWQKQWVHVSSSSSSVSYNHSNTSNSNNNDISAIRIRRWTPVPAAQSAGDSESVAEERPRRKLRYAPIVVLEGKKKEAEKGDVDVKEESKPNRSPAQETSENDDNEKKSIDNVLAAKSQASQKSEEPTKDLNNQPMDLDTGGDDDEEDRDLGGANKVADWVKAAQRGFAR